MTLVKRISFFFVLLFVSESNGAMSALRNTNGICFANATLQCGLAVPGLVNTIQQLGMSGDLPLWHLLYFLYTKHSFMCDPETCIPNAQYLVELLYKADDIRKLIVSPHIFFRVLMKWLLKETNIEHEGFLCEGSAGEDKKLYKITGFEECYSVFCCSQKCNCVKDSNHCDIDGIIDVIPTCKMMVFTLCDRFFLPQKSFHKFFDAIIPILQQAWAIVSGGKKNPKIVLRAFTVSFMMKLTNGQPSDYGHSVAYVNNDACWRLMSDEKSRIIGSNSQELENHLYCKNIGSYIAQLNPFDMPDEGSLVPGEYSLFFYEVII